MPLFSGHRTNNSSIEYSAVGNHVASDVNEGQGDTQPHAQPVDIGPASLDISDRDGASAGKSRTVDQRILETGESSSEKAAGSQNVVTIAGWPREPRRLKGVSIPFLTGDLLLLALPIAFSVLAITAWKLDGEKLSDTGKTVERAMNLGPTIYPLAFAAIGSRCLRSIAIRLAETGTTISTLEKLLGSQSLVSAIGTAFSLRSANVISVGLLLLWALSPLGGQSSLRLLHETNSTISDTGNVFYSDPAAPMDLTEAGYWFALIPNVLGASVAVSESVQNQPVDLWKHPKVPRLDVIEQAALARPDATGDWIDIDASSQQTYTAWTGIVLQGLPSNRKASFQAKSSYVFLDCKRIYSGTPDGALKYLRSSSIAMYPTLPLVSPEDEKTADGANLVLANTTVYGLGPDVSFQQFSTFTLRAVWNSTDSDKSKNETATIGFQKQQLVEFYYGAYHEGTSAAIYQIHSCTPNIATVDARVDCNAGDCEVTRLRQVPNGAEGQCNYGRNRNISCLTRGNIASTGFLDFFPTATTQAYSASLSPFNPYIAGSNTTYRVNPGTNLVNASDISAKTVSDRLTTVVNTYWQAGSWGLQVTSTGMFDTPKYPWTGDSINPTQFINITEAAFSHEVPVYKADLGWIVSLIFITIILLLLSIVNVVVSFMTLAPDLFYYASSLARENPYTNTPDGGTSLDGAERSRLLKKMKVQVADVSPDNEVGYVVLKSVDEGEDFRTGRLRKDRLYW